MSKFAEQKALEAYPICNCYNEQCMMQEDANLESRIGYEEGYDQAMQDFLEKAEEFFNDGLYISISNQICSVDDFTSMTNFIEQFKSYMQNESEN